MNLYTPNQPPNSPFFIDTQATDLSGRDLWLKENSCFAPMRRYHRVPKMELFKIILHLRDPRDTLVSSFFSTAYSHVLKLDKNTLGPTPVDRQRALEMGIDRYVLYKGKEKYLERYNNYIDELLPLENVTLVRYEQMVTDFPSWLTKVLPAFQFPDPDSVLSHCTEKYKDEFKRGPGAHPHKRKVTPGDYKEKLKPDTIRQLEDMYSEVLETLCEQS